MPRIVHHKLKVLNKLTIAAIDLTSLIRFDYTRSDGTRNKKRPVIFVFERKGKYIKFWHHIANHRLNHVKYLLGKKDKPDYLGKIYKIIGESICYGLGLFCKKTDWSILYNK